MQKLAHLSLFSSPPHIKKDNKEKKIIKKFMSKRENPEKKYRFISLSNKTLVSFSLPKLRRNKKYG